VRQVVVGVCVKRWRKLPAAAWLADSATRVAGGGAPPSQSACPRAIGAQTVARLAAARSCRRDKPTLPCARVAAACDTVLAATHLLPLQSQPGEGGAGGAGLWAVPRG
jgi:hypothetical protein